MGQRPRYRPSPIYLIRRAKSGLRALAQGVAREFSLQGIHIVHVVQGGVIDGERARSQFSELVKSKGCNDPLQLNEIVETYWAIHCQPPSA